MDDDVERCDGCGFDANLWDGRAADRTLASAGRIWRSWLDGIDLDLANRRPRPEVWSILEYADHVRQAFWLMRFVVDLGQESPGYEFEPIAERPLGEAESFDTVDDVLDGLAGEGVAMFDTVRAVPPEHRTRFVVEAGRRLDTDRAVAHALHECFHHLRDAGRIRVVLGDGVRSQTGTVHSVHLGGGGVPKPAVDTATIEIAGLVGDVQGDRLNHGRPFQAVCLWGTDVIDGLVAEGHPIFPGAAGENLTLAGLDWAALRPGAFIHVGPDVILELSAPAVPCAKNAGWFSDGHFDRIHHEQHPGWSRLYASVVRPGEVRPGDVVQVEPT